MFSNHFTEDAPPEPDFMQAVLAEVIEQGSADFAAGHAAEQRARDEIRRLYAAYVRLLEIGRDRIIAAGGTCDPVDVMEAGDPALVRVRAFLAPSPPPAAP